jgi:hypothetical protein
MICTNLEAFFEGYVDILSLLSVSWYLDLLLAGNILNWMGQDSPYYDYQSYYHFFI